MSGRLQISGQKSYCPWKKENLARVRRDEAAAREEQRQATQGDREVAEARKWANPQELPSISGHVNLFEKEEQQALVHGDERDDARRKKNDKVNDSSRSKVKELPFYLRPPTSPSSRQEPSSEGERKRRRAMDPMSRYHPEEKAEEEETRESHQPASRDSMRRHGSESRKKGRKEKSKDDRWPQRKQAKKEEAVNTSRPSMEDLRRKRLEREKNEQERQKSLLIEASQGGTSSGYHNRFSRH
jgi:hypothetical protein